MRARGALLALLVAAAAVSARRLESFDVRFDRFHLPAFDGHVYYAMAESPAVFTVAPWGYRILTPWLVHLLPTSPVDGFYWLTLLALVLAGALVFPYLRRLGHGEVASLAGVALFGLSGPVVEALRYQLLVEPVTLLLELAFLMALESGAGVAMLALLAALGALSKEFFLFLLPLVWLLRRERAGDRSALREAALAALPALLATLGLRLWWTPHLASTLPGPATAVLALERVAGTWEEWWRSTLLMGLTPLALLGALRRRARPRVLAYAYLLLVTLVPPFLNPVAFFPGDIPRLLLYALPAVLPLALLALDRVWAHLETPPPSWPRCPGLERAAILLTGALLLVPFIVVDRYRRVDLRGSRDAPLVLAVARGTQRMADALARGIPVAFDPVSRPFFPGLPELHQLERMRWFLRDGWGPLPQWNTGEIRMQGGGSTLLLPCLVPQDLEVVLAMDAPALGRLGALVNGRPVGEVRVGLERTETVLRVPAALLFRGDNILALVGMPGPRLIAYGVRPSGRAAPQGR